MAKRIKHLPKTARILGFLALWLSLLIPVVKASPLYQTVPTMPPPTSTASATATEVVQPTPTHSAPTATAPRSTSLPPTQTARAVATGTAITATNSPTFALVVKTLTPLPTRTSLSDTPPQPTSTSKTSPLIQITPTDSQLTSTPGGYHLGWIGVIGGGLVLVLVIIWGLWISRRKKSNPT